MRSYTDGLEEFSSHGTIDGDPDAGEMYSGRRPRPRFLSDSDSCSNSVQRPCLVQRSKSVNGRFSVDCFDNRETKSPPSSLSPTKKVHFADSEGLELVNVKNFEPSTDDFNVLHRPCKTGRANVSSRRKYPLLNLLQGDSPAEVRINNLKACFEMPRLRQDFLQCLRKQHVCLESVFVQDRMVTGIVVVENMAFEKTVSVRYSLDDWLSFNETVGTYISNSSSGNTDRFMVVITVPRRSRSVEFAVRFSIDGQEFWDNNLGKNYRLRDAVSA